MSTKNKLLTLSLVSVLVVSLSGCGSSFNNKVDAGSPESGEKPGTSSDDNGGITAGNLEPKLISVEPDQYIFSIQNQKTVDVTLEFPSSQVFDFQILNQNGDVLYTYSSDKMFMQQVSKKTLTPGEIFEMEIDLSEQLPNLETGKYTLNVWLTSKHDEELRTKIDFEYNGEMTPKLVTLTEVVKFAGQIDPHSIEVINGDEATVVFQLSEPVMEDIESLSLTYGDLITIDYVVNENNQMVIQSITKE